MNLFLAEWMKVNRNYKVVAFLVWIIPIGLTALYLVLIGMALIDDRASGGLDGVASGKWIQDAVNVWNMVIFFPGNTVGRMLPLAFMAVVFAGEYEWRTWKNTVPRTNRYRLILVKLSVLVLVVVIGFSLASLISGAANLFGRHITDVPYSPVFSPTSFGEFILAFTKATALGLLSIIYLGTLAALAAIITRSILGALLVSYGLSLIDALSLGILALIKQLFNLPVELLNLYQLTPTYHIENLWSWVFFDQAATSLSGNLAIFTSAPSMALSALIYGLWIMALIAAAILLFQRQDLTS
ncbi:MAG: hypothetical protein ACERK1_02730 [Anaerolineales bacterium]